MIVNTEDDSGTGQIILRKLVGSGILDSTQVHSSWCSSQRARVVSKEKCKRPVQDYRLIMIKQTTAAFPVTRKITFWQTIPSGF